jgi:cysteine synthase A
MFGAEVCLVPAVPYENPLNCNYQAKEYTEKLENTIWTDQFDNTDNAYAHYISTGSEIWEQTEIDNFVCTTGLGGTLTGVGKYLKEIGDGRTQIWLSDPHGSVLYEHVTSGEILSSVLEVLSQKGFPVCYCDHDG